jgi:hypothetical protein
MKNEKVKMHIAKIKYQSWAGLWAAAKQGRERGDGAGMCLTVIEVGVAVSSA